MSKFGDGIKSARKARGLTQEQMEALAGVSQAAISKAERAETWQNAGRLETLLMIAKALGLSPVGLGIPENALEALGLDDSARVMIEKPPAWDEALWNEMLDAARRAAPWVLPEHWEAATRAAPFLLTKNIPPDAPLRLANMAAELDAAQAHRPAVARDQTPTTKLAGPASPRSASRGR